VAARHLASGLDIQLKVILLGRVFQIRTEEARRNFDALKHSDVEISEVTESTGLLRSDLKDADIIVDAIFGTGIKGKIREPESTAIELINESKAYIIAVDVPSGFSPDGEPFDRSVRADMTLTFHKMKTGLTTSDAKAYAGDVRVVDIGVCDDAEKYVGIGNVQYLARRSTESHKGNSGRILVIGGGAYSGAPALAALAALRTGADIVTLAVPKSVADIVASFSPNLIVRALSSDVLCPEDIPQVLELIGSHDVVIIGMGLGRDDRTKTTISEIIPHCRKVVVDADALHGLTLPPAAGCEVIITPHAGEFAQMRGTETSSETGARVEAVMEFSKQSGVVTLLKGNTDVISDGESVLLNRTGNPGMTVGGTGDVLAGIVGALFAVNPAMDAASCGAFINGAAGDIAFEVRGFGLLATDVIDNITKVMK
ncbi:MAG: NAD(P)H-hydrate dehydratase, partial [Methanosarcinaceae archaeon]|nr:NAD(P)H-hydrate dehydratase [Methanosarcinaceae archaeon]